MDVTELRVRIYLLRLPMYHFFWVQVVGKQLIHMVSCNTAPIPGACGLPATRRMAQVGY